MKYCHFLGQDFPKPQAFYWATFALCSLEIGHLAAVGLSRVVEAADVAASNFQTKYFCFHACQVPA
jgi:hypothetical protein